MPSRKALRMMCKGSERLPSNALPAWSPLWKQLGRIQDAQEKSAQVLLGRPKRPTSSSLFPRTPKTSCTLYSREPQPLGSDDLRWI